MRVGVNSFYELHELEQIGLKTFGDNVKISRKASIYGAENISLGNNVRIDDFCILSGKIRIGNFVHIAAYTGIFAGQAGVTFADYMTASSRCAFYAVSDDYSGMSMTNPMVPDIYKNVTEQAIFVGKHVIIGSGCTVLPGVTIEEGVAVGAMSLINKTLSAWNIYGGIPCARIKTREKELLKKEADFKLRYGV